MSDAYSSEPTPDSGTLPRVLGPFDAIALVVGSIIGSGVFIKATAIADSFYDLKVTPSFGPIIGVWILIGLVSLCGALALAELAAMLPHAGGPYIFLREAYGRLPAFLWGWTEFWIIRTGSLGSLACATVIYLNKFLVLTFAGNSFFDKLLPLGAAEQCGLCILLVVLLTIVNVVSTRWGARVQNVTTVIKVGFLVLLIFAPLLMGRFDARNLTPVWPQELSLDFWRVIGLAMIAVMWPYDGSINISQVAEEIKNSQRNVPLALTVGMLIVIFVYVAVNASYHFVLPMRAVADSSGVAADVCVVLFGTFGGQLATIGVMCSTFGAINSNLLTGSRIYFAIARDGLLPGFLSKVHAGFRTPANSIIAQSAWSIVLLIVAYAGAGQIAGLKARIEKWQKPAIESAAEKRSEAQSEKPAEPQPFDARDAFDTLTDFVIFGGSIFYSMAVGAVYVLRFKRPDLPRPYRAWGYPVTPALYLLTFATALASLLYEKWAITAAGVTLILSGVAYYFIVSRWRK